MTIKYTAIMRVKNEMKTVKCKEGCGNTMKIAGDSVAGICWSCVNKMMSNPYDNHFNADTTEDTEDSNETDD